MGGGGGGGAAGGVVSRVLMHVMCRLHSGKQTLLQRPGYTTQQQAMAPPTGGDVSEA